MKEKLTKVKELGIKNFKWIMLFILLLIVIAIIEDVFDKEIVEFDMIGYNAISSIISSAVTPIAIVITNLGRSSSNLCININIVFTNKK